MKQHVLISILLLTYSAMLFGQSDILNRKVKIENRKGTVGSILDEISREGAFYFSYNQDISPDRKVGLQHNRQTVQQYLDEIFGGKIYCVAYENKLLIKLKPELPEFYTVRGKVIDSGNGDPIPAVTVIIPGSDPLIGAVSDDSGRFQINVPHGMDAIMFSCIGYESLRHIPEEQKQSTIGLMPISMKISEAVIDSYKPPVKMESSVAISYLSGDKLERIRGASFEDALQGGVSGINVVRNSGMPGASFQVKIRGNNSLINSDPVYYLNGIPLQRSLLNAISCYDIASVEILKDASSAATYGASAGNGVILLQSKSGSNDRINVSLNYQVGTQRFGKELNLMDKDEFLDFYKKVRPADSKFDYIDEALTEIDADWMELMFEPAKIEEYHFSISGGNERSQFYVGSGYFNQASIIEELQFNRFSLNFNSRHQIGQRWHLGHHLTFAHMTHKGLKEGCFLNDHNNPVIQSLSKPPLSPPADSLTDQDYTNGLPHGSDLDDVPSIEYVGEELTHNLRKNYAVIGNMFSRVDISRIISFETNFGYEVYYQNNLSCNRTKDVQIRITNNPVHENEYQVLDLAYQWHNRLNFRETIAEIHQVRASLGFEFGQNENQWIPVKKSVLSLSSSQNTAPVQTELPNEYDRCSVDYRHRAALGTVSYILKDKYILNGSLRRELVGFDSTENVHKEYAAWYPSVSLGWIFLQRKENFSKGILQFGKIRYAYGVAGNSPRLNYSFHAKMMRDMAYVYSFESAGRITNSSNQRQTNNKFYWERISAHNLGVELGLFGNKLFVSADLFRNHLDRGIQSGYTNPDYLRDLFGGNWYGINVLPVAELVNSGIESEITYRKSGALLNWDLSFNMTHFNHSIIQIDKRAYSSSTTGSKDPIPVNLPGETPGSFYGYRIERLFGKEDCPAPDEPVTNQPYRLDSNGNKIYAQPNAHAGDYKFMDINKDSVIDKNDKTIIGNPYPDFIFGIYANLQFRQFDLSMFWQGSYGNEIYNATKLWLYNPYSTSNWSRDVLNSWGTPQYNEAGEPTGILTETGLHRFDYYAENKNLRVSDFYVEDGSYLRLKNIQLGYTFHPALTRKIHIQKLRIYICARNLFTFTRYSGLDPEVGGWGIDCGIYPQARTYIAGINLDF